MKLSIAELSASNPLVRRFIQERELRQTQRLLKRAKAKAKANRDKLVTQLALMPHASADAETARRRHKLLQQVANFNAFLRDER